MNFTEFSIVNILKRSKNRQYFSVYYLAKKLNKCPSTISRSLKSLEEKGVIERYKVRDRYYLTKLTNDYEKLLLTKKEKEIKYGDDILKLFQKVLSKNT